MTRLRIVLLILAVALVATPAFAQKATGNGSQSGSHYNLNIIGVEKAKTQDLTDSNRHTIFVDLYYSDPTPKVPTPLISLNPKNKIFLQEGPTFEVIDGNAWDGAIFQLPAPGCTGVDVAAANLECDYSVYIRGLGSPQNNPYAQMTTCGIDDNGTPSDKSDDWFQCSTETVTVSRTKGKSSFTNVTKELLTLCLDTNTDLNYDGQCDVRVQLFDQEFYQYFWDYDNHGLRLAQLRFYPTK